MAIEVASDINKIIKEHISGSFSNRRTLELSQQFQRDGQITIRDMVPDEIRDLVKNEVLRLLTEHSERRDLVLNTTGGTPRNMDVVRSEVIADNSDILQTIYKSKHLIGFLERLAGEKLFACPVKDEEFLITRQTKPRDTHGWHWGDFRYALIWLPEVPDVEAGGMLQTVPHTIWNKKEPRIHYHLCTNPIKTYSFLSGDLYFLKADTTLHRTVPLTREATRIILNMTWACKEDIENPLAWDDRWWENKDVTEAVADD
ncbi:MAG: ArpA protein [Acidobacteriota bacterium]|nr:ArpA protein [Acidobacteriota bacterium]